VFCSAFVSCSVRAPPRLLRSFPPILSSFLFSLSLSLSLVHLKLLLLLFVSGASGQHVEIQIQLPPGFESFGADDIRSQTNNFATVIFFCFSSYTSSCTFLVMYVVKFCLLSFFLVMNMSEVRNQSSFCRVLVIWFSWFEFCIRSMIFFPSEASESILSRIELFPSCRPVFSAFVCEAFLIPCCF